MIAFGKIKKLLAKAKNADQAVVSKAETGLSKAVGFIAKTRIKSQGGVQKDEDWLLAGDKDKFAEARYGVKRNSDGTIDHNGSRFPHLTQEVPEDLRHSLDWNGRTPDGQFMWWTGYSNITQEDGRNIETSAVRTGVRVGQAAGLFALALGLSTNLKWPGMPVAPWDAAWMTDLPLSTKIHVWSSGVAVYAADAIGKVTELLSSNVWPITACLTLSALVFAMSTGSATAISLNKVIGPWKHSLTFVLTMPSQDSHYHWRFERKKTAAMMVKYANSIGQALGWRKHLPLFKLGETTGLLGWRGDPGAPYAGQEVCLDGISIRQNIYTGGGTGSGKTRDLLLPLAKTYFESDFRERDSEGNIIRDHKAGMLALDGKGKIAFDLPKVIPEHRMADVKLVGTEDGLNVMDVTRGMSISEVVELYILLAKQKAGVVDNEQWIKGSGNALGHSGYFGKLLESRKVTIGGKDPWLNREYSPSSLMGMVAIALETSLNFGIGTWVMKQLQNGVSFDTHVIDAARFFTGEWKEMAVETRSSYISNISNTFGDLAANKRLAERFASGETKKYPTVNIEDIFDGKILLLGLSEIADGPAGKTIANFIKQRAYLLAQKRLAESSKAIELLGRVDDCRQNLVSLQKRATALMELEILLQDVEFAESGADLDSMMKETVAIFRKRFPAEKRFDLRNMKWVNERAYSGVENKIASFTDDVQTMAFNSEEGAKLLKHYQEVADAPLTSSCMVMIDEYQDYITDGDGGKADTTFLAKCRETGMFLVVATQTVHALSKNIGHVKAMELMANFTTKIFFKTDDPDNAEFIIKSAGSAFQSRPYAANLFPNFTQLLDAIGNALVPPPLARFIGGLWPSLHTTINDQDVFHCVTQDIEVGTKADLSSNIDHDQQNVNEGRNRLVAMEDAQKTEMKEGSVQPLVTMNDIVDFEEGYAFVIWNRAGTTRRDFVYLRK
ncbi:TraM recognition domain-containing protein [Mesorhizobium sp. A623]